MAQGDAFNRREVSSVYVGTGHRFVISLIVGVNADNVEDAAAVALGMTKYPRKGDTVWCVHDRQSGESHEVRQSSFEDEDAVYVEEPG